VMTRQPAAENRFTVAWPMPRLAPVRRRVRRGLFGLIILSDCPLPAVLEA
jgi:hypothetical protein